MPHTPETRERAFQKMKDARSAWFMANGPCRQCGSWDRLEVDHIDPASKVTHNFWSWKKERRDAELYKCQPLCYHCHKRKTINQLTRPLNHGRPSAWVKGCRCEVCKEWSRGENKRRIRVKGKYLGRRPIGQTSGETLSAATLSQKVA